MNHILSKNSPVYYGQVINMNIGNCFDHPNYISGITLKDSHYPEENNMGLHACDDVENVLNNRQELANQLQVPLDQFVFANQTHSANFHQVTAEDANRGATQVETAIPNTDALYTYEPNLVLCSLTADCVPVLFYHEANGLIGAIHSGWQGTVKEITRKLFNHLKEEEQCNLEQVYVHIGRALSQEKFEVDEDVYTQFKNLGYVNEFMYMNKETNKYHINNQQVVKKQCEIAGIPNAQITIDATCTFLSDDGFSYRQHKQCGRHNSFIMRKE